MTSTLSRQPSTAPSFRPSSVPSSRPSSACPVGTFVNSTTLECNPCPPGSYQDKASYSSSCKTCDAGSSQPDEGQSTCVQCRTGTFQDATGQTQCKECRAGGYCSAQKIGTCDGGFTPCPVGTFNVKKGATDATFCLPCPAGKSLTDNAAACTINTSKHFTPTFSNTTFVSIMQAHFRTIKRVWCSVLGVHIVLAARETAACAPSAPKTST